MPSIEDEIKKLRRGRSRSLILIGIIALTAIVYATFDRSQNSPRLLADIGNVVQQEVVVPPVASVPPTPTPTPVAIATSIPTVSETMATVVTATTSEAETTSTPAPTSTPAETTPVPTPTPALAITTAAATPIAVAAPTPEIATPAATSTIDAAPPPPALTTPAIPIPLPYRANTFEANDGWRDWWGDFSEASGTLTIGANASTTGSGALLGGSDAWTNYTFQATVDWTKGDSFGLLARYTPDDDYIACEFNQPSPGVTHMYLDEYTGGKGITLASVGVPNYNQTGGSNITASIAVRGSQGTCTFNGYSLSSGIGGATQNFPAAGGIGFVTWDPDVSNSQIVVTGVNVSSN